MYATIFFRDISGNRSFWKVNYDETIKDKFLLRFKTLSLPHATTNRPVILALKFTRTRVASFVTRWMHVEAVALVTPGKKILLYRGLVVQKQLDKTQDHQF